MRQVPKILIYGSGNLARHWAHYLNLLQVPFEISNRATCQNHISKIDSYSQIFLAISDDAILNVYSQYKKQTTADWFHFSGSQYFKDITGIHPLQTFSDKLYTLKEYKKIPLFIDHLDQKTKNNLSYLPNKINYIQAKQKKLYHAVCVLAGNLPLFLWHDIEELLKPLEINKADLRPYLNSCLENFLSNKKNYLSGPIYRGDKKTIEDNLSALKNHHNRLHNIYKSFYNNYGEKNVDSHI